MQKLTASLSAEYKVMATLLIDRLVFTPPFLFFTLFYRQLLNNNNMSAKYKAVMKVIMSALWVNWKVWTALVAFNITYIPLEYRSIFGNVFALAWNTYLSLIS
jgi:protein Mpv17